MELKLEDAKKPQYSFHEHHHRVSEIEQYSLAPTAFQPSRANYRIICCSSALAICRTWWRCVIMQALTSGSIVEDDKDMPGILEGGST